jgi:hypothetical protein
VISLGHFCCSLASSASALHFGDKCFSGNDGVTGGQRWSKTFILGNDAYGNQFI